MKSKRSNPFSFGADPKPADPPESVEAAADAAPATEPDADLAILTPAEPPPPVRHAPPLPPSRMADPEALPKNADGRAMAWAFLATLLWAGGLAAFVIGYQSRIGPFQLNAFTITLFVLLCLAPAGFIVIGARALVQARRIAGAGRRAQALADEMLVPAAAASAQAGDAIALVRRQIDEAAAVAQEARESMLALREALAIETDRLAQAAAGSVRTARELAETLGRERANLDTVSATLDARTVAVTEAIGSQARMVAEASDLAETQLREAEALLAARAADLAAAAGEAGDAARIASEDLGRQVARLETAGLGVGDQMRLVEQEITQQRAALVTVAHALRADHDDFSAQTESRVAQLAEFVNHARMGASEMGAAALESGRHLTGLVDAATAQFRTLADQAEEERASLSEALIRSLDAFADAADAQRLAMEASMRASVDTMGAAAEETRRAVERQAELARAVVAEQREAAEESLKSQIDAVAHAVAQTHEAVERQADLARAVADEQRRAAEQALREQAEAMAAAAEEARQVVLRQTDIARARVDQLSEAAFVAGQRADSVFEQRLNDARDLIDRSAALVEQAGAQTVQKLETTVGAARQTVAELERLLAEVGDRAVALPEAAQEKALEVKAAVERGVEDLLAAAQRTAEQTQAIDAAFQERIRKNYEMLSEAVRLMGVAAGPGTGGGALSALRSPPLATPPPIVPPPTPEPANAEQAGLRPRLKLTPTATDDEFRTVFNTASGRGAPPPPPPASENGDLGWKDILLTVDNSGPPTPPPIGDRIAREIESMGIDPTALLPKVRVDEIAAAVQTGDLTGAREVVRSLAPAAVRRLTRRLFSDQGLSADANAFTDLYAEMLRRSANEDRGGYLVGQLLGTPAGRAFLLLDAASADRF